MNGLPTEVQAVVNDFRFGTNDYWKKSFKSVVAELDDNILYLKTVYELVHCLDLNDDDEYIDFFTVSILMHSLWRWRELKKAFPEICLNYTYIL